MDAPSITSQFMWNWEECLASFKVDLDRVTKTSWISTKGSVKSCPWGVVIPYTSTGLQPAGWKAALQRETLGSCWQHALVAKMTSGVLGCFGQSIPSRRRCSFPSTPHWGDPSGALGLVLGFPGWERCGLREWAGTVHPREEVQGILSTLVDTWRSGTKEDGARLLGGARWQDKQQWARSETWSSIWTETSAFSLRMVDHWDRLPREACVLSSYPCPLLRCLQKFIKGTWAAVTPHNMTALGKGK